MKVPLFQGNQHFRCCTDQSVNGKSPGLRVALMKTLNEGGLINFTVAADGEVACHDNFCGLFIAQRIDHLVNSLAPLFLTHCAGAALKARRKSVLADRRRKFGFHARIC